MTLRTACPRELVIPVYLALKNGVYGDQSKAFPGQPKWWRESLPEKIKNSYHHNKARKTKAYLLVVKLILTMETLHQKHGVIIGFYFNMVDSR